MDANKYVREVLQDKIDILKQLMEQAKQKGIYGDYYIRMEKISILEKHIEELKGA